MFSLLVLFSLPASTYLDPFSDTPLINPFPANRIHHLYFLVGMCGIPHRYEQANS